MNFKLRNIQLTIKLPVLFVIVMGFLFTSALAHIIKPLPAQAATPTISCGTSEVNVIAHQDDDILFMNPDIQDSITQKRCVVSVFLTAGEYNGTPTMTREQYAASRMEGTRAAYATMANVANTWTRSATTINGRSIETARLNGAPHVQLVYLHIRDGGDSISSNNLIDLFKGIKPSITTMVPTNSPDGIAAQSFTKTTLTQTLTAIMRDYKSTVIRTQDYLPDPRLRANHKDHIHGALFAIIAARAYNGINNNLNVNTVTYRDYNIVEFPVNLSAAQNDQKNKTLDAYHAHDELYGLPASQDNIASRMYYRWPVAPTWVAKNKDGRLQAFDVRNGRLMTWKQNTNGTWAAMQNLGNTWLQPGVAVATNADGTLQVFAVRQVVDSQGGVRQDVQYIKQTTPNGAFSKWVSLGNPGVHATKKTYDIGSPSAVRNADGRMEVFVKDSNGNLSTRYQTRSGAYGSWVNLGGSGALMETPASVLRKDGRIEVFAATRGVVKHWLQRAPNATIVYDTAFSSAQAVGTPSVGFNQDGRPEIFYRRAGSGQTYTTYQLGTGKWSSPETALGGQASQGAPAVVNNLPTYQAGSRIMLFSRKSPSGYEKIAQRKANASFLAPWVAVNNTFSQHSPTAILDSKNKVHFIGFSQDGALLDTPTLP